MIPIREISSTALRKIRSRIIVIAIGALATRTTACFGTSLNFAGSSDRY
jgi:hypothetical protein